MTMNTQTSIYSPLTTAISFEPQQTQNTALVIEHRCLYTHDLRRKAKRWQDGFLRFHTFNKRIMIYDVPRNYIGDTHWREENPVQDGDEFELDRPILVQVGEQSGSVEQDLSGLLERRHKKNHETTVRPSSYATSLPTPIIEYGLRRGPQISTHLRPKSLNAVLGTPTRTLGRASLPVKSPFEVRRAAENPSVNAESPAKRRCIEAPAELTQPPVHRRGPAGSSLKGPLRDVNTKNLKTRSKATTLQMSHSEQQSILVADPRKETETPILKPTGTPTPRRKRVSQLDDIALSSHTERRSGKEIEGIDGQTIQSNRNARLQRVRPGKKNNQHRHLEDGDDTTEESRSKISREPMTTIKDLSRSETGTSSSIEQPRTRSKLCLVSRKPRRKLMYKDLLLRDMPVVGKTVRSEYSNDESNMAGFKPEHCKAQSVEPLSQDRLQFTLGDEDGRLVPKHISGELIQPANNRATASVVSKQADPVRQAKRVTQADKSPPQKTIQPIHCQTSSTVHNTNLALAAMDQILLSQSQPRRPSSSPDPSHFDGCPPIQELFSLPDEPRSEFPDLRNSDFRTPLPEDQEMQASTTASIAENISSPTADRQIVIALKAKPSCVSIGVNQASESLSSAASQTQTVGEISSKSCQGKSLHMPSPPNIRHKDPTSPHETPLDVENPRRPTSARSEIFSVATGAAKPIELPTLHSSETGLALLASGGLQDRSEKRLPSDPGVSKAASSLPPFKPPCPTSARQRSAVKKSVSNTSVMIGTSAVSKASDGAKLAGDANCTKEHLTSPWSKEAWDLFGCGRDGKIVDFKSFCLSEEA